MVTIAPAGREVIVLSDGDDPDKPAAIDLEAWVAKWRSLGRRIVIARPRPEWTGHKYDFNDLLQEQGPAPFWTASRSPASNCANSTSPISPRRSSPSRILRSHCRQRQRPK